MKLPYEFIRLPYTFDVKKLSEEVLKYSEKDWVPHPDGFEGNSSIPLLSVNGEINNKFCGEIKPTIALRQSPYLMQVIASFGEVFGRSRLMRLSPGCEVPMHSDTSYHWQKRVRIHIPIITDSDVLFQCENKNIHMEAGDTWIFDAWKYHKVENNGKTNRVHLVIDTAGSSAFWEMVSKAEVYSNTENWESQVVERIRYELNKNVSILCERYNMPLVMSPGEMDGCIYEVIDELVSVESNNPEEILQVKTILAKLSKDWRRLWSLFNAEEAGWESYNELRQRIFNEVNQLKAGLLISNGASLTEMLLYCVLEPSLNTELAGFDSRLEDNTVEKINDGTPVNRNSPCYCGSGEKFKYCHGKLN